MGWPLMLHSYSVLPTVRAAVNSSRPYSEHYKGAGFLVPGPSTVRAVQMLAALTVWEGSAVLVSFSRSAILVVPSHTLANP